MSVEVREPVVTDAGNILDIRAVVFVQGGTVECRLSLMYGPGWPDHTRIHLMMEDKQEAVHVYDLFNGIFKSKAHEMKGLRKHKRTGKLEVEWKIRKEEFRTLLEEIKDRFGDEWYNAFSLVSARIGSPLPGINSQRDT